MNIKNLRRNYETLTKLERLSLADKAEARDDENEINAIIAASPKHTYRQADFYELKQNITLLRLCNLITRFGYVMLFDLFLDFECRDEERISNDARLAAFLYVRATDAWQTVNDEIGLQSDFEASISEHLFAFEIFKLKADLMREAAFNEQEARDFIKAKTGSDKIKTLDDEIKSIREALGLE